MSQSSILKARLEEFFNIWNKSLKTNKLKKHKINFLMPIIQLTSYLHYLEKPKSPNEKTETFKILENFKKFYEDVYKTKIDEMNISDFSEKLLKKISEVQDDNKKTKLSSAYKTEILSYKDKYYHAHSRISFKYGEFFNKIVTENPNHENFAEINDLILSLKTEKSSDEFEKKLIQIEELAKITFYSGVLEKDDLENNALLNQMSDWQTNIPYIIDIFLDDKKFEKAKKFLVTKRNNHKFSLKKDEKINNYSNESLEIIAQNFLKKGLKSSVGIETEFGLNPFNAKIINNKSAEFAKNLQDVELKKVLSDLNARRKMQIKYLKESYIPEIKDIELFFNESTGQNLDLNSVIGGKNYNEITIHLKNILPKKEHKNIERHVAKFSDEESFFYHLLFLEKDFAIAKKIEIGGVFDPEKTERQNVEKTYNLIKYGKFHESCLDMIQAYEIAFGPHNFAQIIDIKDEILLKIKLLANQSNLSLDNPNLQLNFSFELNFNDINRHIFSAIISKDKNGKILLKYNQLGVEILKIMQNSLAELASISGILRNQSKIESRLDLKKTIGFELEGSDYLKFNQNKPAFLIHKESTGRTATIRTSVIKYDAKNTDNNIGVAEIRIIANI